MAMHSDSKRSERSKAKALTRRENVKTRQASKRDADKAFKALVERVK